MRRIEKVHGLAFAGIGLIALAGCGGGGGGSSASSAALQRVAYTSTVHQANGEIYVVPVTGIMDPVRITTNTVENFSPIVNLDNSKVAYVEVDGSGNSNIMVTTLDPITGAPLTSIQVTADAYGNDLPCWSPDGKKLMFVRYNMESAELPAGIYEVEFLSDGTITDPELVIEDASHPCYNPNNHTIAYTADLDTAIYTVALETGAERVKIMDLPTSTINGLSWSPDGSKLTFSAYSGSDKASLYTVNAQANATPVPITSPLYDCGGPVWTKGGRIVFFAGTTVDGNHSLYIIDSTGSNMQELVPHNGGNIYMMVRE